MGLKVTLILPFLPGLMGLEGYSGRVQPHEAVASMMSSGLSPVLVNSKLQDTGPLASLMVPKSWLLTVKVASAYLSSAHRAVATMHIAKNAIKTLLVIVIVLLK